MYRFVVQKESKKRQETHLLMVISIVAAGTYLVTVIDRAWIRTSLESQNLMQAKYYKKAEVPLSR